MAGQVSLETAARVLAAICDAATRGATVSRAGLIAATGLSDTTIDSAVRRLKREGRVRRVPGKARWLLDDGRVVALGAGGRKRGARHGGPGARGTARRCLGCGKHFASSHVGNRLCQPCREGAAASRGAIL